jgi:hypothetical protein
MRRAGSTRLQLPVVLGAVLLVPFCLCLGLTSGALAFGFYLVAGWVFFLWEVAPRVRADGSAVLTAVVCLVGFLAGLHLFLRWFVGQWKRAGDDAAPPRRWELRWTLGVVGLVVLAFTAGIAAVGMTHQTAWLFTQPQPMFESSMRRLAARTNSLNNLKQIGLGIHDYSDQGKALPPGATFDSQGRALHGWQTALLPYIEQEQLYKEIKQHLPWTHPGNAAAFRTVLRTYQHPLAEPTLAPSGMALSHYAANVHVLGGNVRRTLAQIGEARGASQTILAGEAAGNFKPWGYPANWRDPARGLGRSPDGFGHPSGTRQPTQFVFADGSVRTFTQDTDPAVLEALAGSTPGRTP